MIEQRKPLSDSSSAYYPEDWWSYHNGPVFRLKLVPFNPPSFEAEDDGGDRDGWEGNAQLKDSGPFVTGHSVNKDEDCSVLGNDHTLGI